MHRLFLVALILVACVLPGCMSQASDDYHFYDELSKYTGQLPAESKAMAASMNAGDYVTAKQQAESIILKLDALKEKLSMYELKNSQAQLVYAESVPFLASYRSSMENFVASMDARIDGKISDANKYIDLATADMTEAEKHIEKINKILP